MHSHINRYALRIHVTVSDCGVNAVGWRVRYPYLTVEASSELDGRRARWISESACADRGAGATICIVHQNKTWP